jgi:hypothetical protein
MAPPQEWKISYRDDDLAEALGRALERSGRVINARPVQVLPAPKTDAGLPTDELPDHSMHTAPLREAVSASEGSEREAPRGIQGASRTVMKSSFGGCHSFNYPSSSNTRSS